MQFIDLKAQYQRIKLQVDKAVMNSLAEGRYIMGPSVKTLEDRLASFVGRRHCITCGNGTDALSMALTVLGIGEGDAVFVPNFTFFASAEVISQAGATPVFVDTLLSTFNIDPARLEEAILDVKREGKWTPKAVIPVDLFGQPADYDAILPIAQKHGLRVIEDGAQGFGGTFQGRRCCSFGDISTTSFFPAKPLGCYGDGGALFTDDDYLAELLRSIRVHGSGSDKYDNVRIGYNSRLDTIQAAVLHCKLDIFEDELIGRDAVATAYTERLAGIPSFVLPKVPEGFTSSWAQFTVLTESPEKRAVIMEELRDKGIPTMIYYQRPMHSQTAFADMGCTDDQFPVSVQACRRVLSLPMHPYLKKEDIAAVCDALEASCR